jgi:integrase
MASIHRDPRSPYWFCALTLPDGKRTFRSTKQRERKKALEVCRAWEKAAKAAKEGELVESQARRVLDDILKAVGEKAIRQDTTRDFFNRWLEGKRVSKSVSTFQHYRQVVREFLHCLGNRADKALASLNAQDIEIYRDSMLKNGVSATGVKKHLITVRAVLSVARKQGLIDRNATDTVELPKTTAIQRDVFEPAQVRALLRVANPDWKTAILIGFYSGARLGDVANLTWVNVDLQRGTISYRQIKTNTTVEFPVHEDLQARLLEIAGDNPNGHLCPTLAGRTIGGGRGLSLEFGQLMTEAGLDQRKVAVNEKRSVARLSFHSLRHSFASALANSGISSDIRKKLVGHSSDAIHAKYTHLELSPLRTAIGTLPSLLK